MSLSFCLFVCKGRHGVILRCVLLCSVKSKFYHRQDVWKKETIGCDGTHYIVFVRRIFILKNVKTFGFVRSEVLQWFVWKVLHSIRVHEGKKIEREREKKKG